MVRDNFAVFILTHGRPDNVLTYKTLQICNYTGKVYFILDSDDKTIDQYKQNFGEDRIIIFDKKEIEKTCDPMDNQHNYNVILYARNACFEIAKKLGLTYFVEFDDDYYEIKSRLVKDGKLTSCWIFDIDSYIEATLDFLDESGAKSVCWSQMGDFIGGVGATMIRERVTRKAMNSWFCRVDRPFKFSGTLNDDVNTYCSLGMRGDLFLSVCDVSINQVDSQQGANGITDMYKQQGTYAKSFYTVMCCPSFVKVAAMGDGHWRYHHNVKWENAVPKIISSRFRNYDTKQNVDKKENTFQLSNLI